MTSILNEYCQQQGIAIPQFTTFIDGPPHRPSITVTTTMFGKVFTAQSTTRKEAKQLCSQKIIDHFDIQLKPSSKSPSSHQPIIKYNMDKTLEELWDNFNVLTLTLTKKEGQCNEKIKTIKLQPIQ